MIRRRIRMQGLVQGVGFRPFVYRLAHEERLGGWIRNDLQGVTLEVEGGPEQVGRLLERLPRELPPLARLDSLVTDEVASQGETEFRILASHREGPSRALILPDCATCADCLADIRDPGNRRYRYPFTNCTNCGPRYSIIESLPYDRTRTTMGRFTMCAACLAEYHDPGDRRFHAQPNACPQCGPQLSLGQTRGEEALRQAAQLLRQGGILALKGLGGFQLLVCADDEAAVARLRERKRRPSKPLAVLVADLERARELAWLEEAEARALTSPAAPILLVRRLDACLESSTPGNPWLGLMLPCTPLHHLLVGELARPLVATSGNLSGEPLCIDNEEARQRLAGIADDFLVHDRPIARRLDDSVAFYELGAARVLRRARGYVPLALPVDGPPLVAVGGHQKATVTVTDGSRALVGAHVGDLDAPLSREEHERGLADLLRLSGLEAPSLVARDAHPDYASSLLAASLKLPQELVWHHHAHLASGLAEHGRRGPALGIIWDGTGLGPDGTIWGGEFLRGDRRDFERVAHLRQFSLPGGDKASREPLRSAAGVLAELGVTLPEAPPVWARLRGPRTSSMGRLFDAVAWLVGLGRSVSFEGEAAMELEFAADSREEGAYALVLEGLILDWEPALRQLLADRSPPGKISARFHNGLVEGAVEVARRAGESLVVLSGGCMQNRFLLRRLVGRLEQEGIEVLVHRQVPPNDGGLSFGQAAVACARRS